MCGWRTLVLSKTVAHGVHDAAESVVLAKEGWLSRICRLWQKSGVVYVCPTPMLILTLSSSGSVQKDISGKRFPKVLGVERGAQYAPIRIEKMNAKINEHR
jgi:hypothetical protein